MIIKVVYENGQMMVDLTAMFKWREMRRVKKLFKLIRESYTVYIRDDSSWVPAYDSGEFFKTLKEEIEENIPKLEESIIQYASGFEKYSRWVKEKEEELQTCRYRRDVYQKKSPEWEELNDKVKTHIEVLKEFRDLRNRQKKILTDLQRDKTFMEKVLLELERM